jgi:hypothetical protein
VTDMPRKVHPAQRYEVHARRPYEYLGAAGRFDVFWLPDQRKILVKPCDAVGVNFSMRYPKTTETDWEPGCGNAGRNEPSPTNEEKDLFWSMARCFAQANRPEEWDATTDASAPEVRHA